MARVKTEEEKKHARIIKAMDTAATALEREGVKYFIGVVDRDPTATDGGKAFAQSDVTGEDMTYILGLALPTRQDIINLGIWVGQLIQAHNKKQ